MNFVRPLPHPRPFSPHQKRTKRDQAPFPLDHDDRKCCIFAAGAASLPSAIHSLTKCVLSPDTDTQTYHLACCGFQQQPENTDAETRRVSPLDPALSAFNFPRQPHLALCMRDRPRRQKLLHHPRCQKLLHHRRMPFPRSKMQRRFSILRRAAALSQAHSLSPRKCVRPLPPRRTSESPNLERGGIKMERDN